MKRQRSDAEKRIDAALARIKKEQGREEEIQDTIKKYLERCESFYVAPMKDYERIIREQISSGMFDGKEE